VYRRRAVKTHYRSLFQPSRSGATWATVASSQSNLFSFLMVKAALIVLVVALVSLSGPIAHAACTPGAGQVSFFVDANFGGACVTKGIGNYATADAIGLPNDSISSVKLGPGTQVELCKDVNFGGDCILLTQSSSFINDSQVGNDAVSSAKVQATATAQCSPGAGQACFCTDANFLGQCVTKPVGNYPTADALGIPNDSLSSVKLGPGVQVELCNDVNYGGDCILQTVSTGLLNGSQVPNDSVSSAKVQATGTLECPPSANQVSFYTDANYLGQCVTKGIGDWHLRIDRAAKRFDLFGKARTGHTGGAVQGREFRWRLHPPDPKLEFHK
jgi:hypothetical protein